MQLRVENIRCTLKKGQHMVAMSCNFGRGVHGLDKPKKPKKLIQKTPKKWVGLGDWMDMVLKNKKPIKNNGFWVKPYSDPTNPLTQ